MTFDVFAPTEKANGAGVLFMVSGGWYSRWALAEQTQGIFRPLTDRGFTVFAVRHGSSQLVTIAGAGHGFQGNDLILTANAMVGWFEMHLAKP